MTAGPGHNGGPTMEPGASWRRHCWAEARNRLLPTLPIEVLRGRLRRAQELGLDYRSYASVRAASGHDVIAFLFSTNALRLHPPAGLPAERQQKLAALMHCGRIALAQGATPERVLACAGGLLDAAAPAPGLLAGFGVARDHLRAALGRLPADRVILIGDHSLEREWCAAGRLAGYIPAERYFPPA